MAQSKKSTSKLPKKSYSVIRYGLVIGNKEYPVGSKVRLDINGYNYLKSKKFIQ